MQTRYKMSFEISTDCIFMILSSWTHNPNVGVKKDVWADILFDVI